MPNAEAQLRAPDRGSAEVPSRAWRTMLARSAPALLGALAITFSPDHSPRLGLAVFGVVALVTGVLVAFEAIGIRRHPTRGITFARGVVTAAAGGAGLALVAIHGDAIEIRALLWLVGAWALVSGALEIVGGWLARRRGPLGRDALITGALTLGLGLALALVPPDLREPYGGIEQVDGALTAATQAVGFLGAYFALLGVVLIIEGLSLRLGASRHAAAVAERGEGEKEITQ